MSQSKSKQQRRLARDAARVAPMDNEAKRTRAITVGALIACAALVIGIIAGVVIMLQKDDTVDYLKDDLSRYIYISEENYKNFAVDIHIKAPDDADVAMQIMKYQAARRTPVGNGLYKTEGELGPGDTVLIYYRGYTVGENGEQIPFAAGTNFSDNSPYSLDLGSCSRVSGIEYSMIEYSMIGTRVEDYPTLIESGTVAAGQTVYVTYERVGEGGITEYGENVRLDLAQGVDGIMGVGFTDALIGKEIGKALDPISVTLNGISTSYQTLKVRFATSEPAHTVSAYFPHDYGPELLRGRTVSFDIYALEYIDYDVPEVDADFIRDVIGISDDQLNLHEGNTPLKKLENMVRADLDAEYILARESLIEDAAWDHLMENARVYRLPSYEVERKYDVYYSELSSLYEYYGSSYASVGEFIRRYYGLSASADWQAFLTEQARVAVAQKLLFYYVIRQEGWMPDAQEYEALYAAAVDELLEQKLTEEGCDRDDYATDEAYEAAVSVLRRRVEAQYGQTYFMDLIYSEYGTALLLEGVSVNQK